MAIPLLIPGNFSRRPIDLFYIPPCQKTLQVPGRRPFAFLMLELVPRMRHFTVLHAKKVWPWKETWPGSRDQNFPAWGNIKGHIPGTGRLFQHLGMQKICFQGPEESGRLFRHGRGKKSNSKDIMHKATTPATTELTTAETLASAWVHQHGCQQQQGDLGRCRGL